MRRDLSLCVGLVLASAGCLDRRPQATDSRPSECTGCHGSPGRAGSELYRAAPPTDLDGNDDAGVRGVGAHQMHLTRAALTRVLDCSECHIVPAAVLSPGHIDTLRPAEVTFSGRATLVGFQPVWDGVKCTNTYCHAPGNGTWGGTNRAPEWTGQNQVFCGTCHGLPPPWPHPQNDTPDFMCATCHSNVTETLDFIDRSRHINGTVELTDADAGQAD